MNLRRLRIERFGQLADVTLPLDPGFQLLYGANEAGKSTLLAAVRAFLFGFPRGAGWDFRFAGDTLAVAAELAFADGSGAEVRREKKQGLRGKYQELVLTDELFKARLGHPTEELFSTAFAFSLEDLARGGEALRDEGMKSALAGAGAGVARSPQGLVAELRAQAESLFTVKGRAGKPINAALAELKRKHKELAQVEVRGEDYRARVAQLTGARAEAARLAEHRGELLARVGQLESLARALPRRDELRGALAELEALHPPPGLAANAAAEYERSLGERARAGEALSKLDRKLGQAERELEALVVDEALLAARARIAPLHEDLGRHLREAEEASELAAQLRARRAELARQLQELRPGWKLAELDVLPHPLFTSGLERLREGWSGHRERAQELERLRSELDRLDGERRSLRRKLDPPWASDGEEREWLPVPRAEEVKRHRSELDRHERALAELRRDAERLRDEKRRLSGELERLDAGGAVPSRDELERLRARRDAGFVLVRRELAGENLGAEAAQYDARPLADAVADAIAAADRHADELRRRSDEVAARGELLLRLADGERALADRQAQIAAVIAELDQALAAWAGLWTRSGFAPHSPDAMLEWLADYALLRDLDGKRALLDERLRALAAAQDDYERRVRALLQTLRLDVALDLPTAKRVIDIVLSVRQELEALRSDELRARRLAAGAADWREQVRKLAAELARELVGDGSVGDAARTVRALHERWQAAAQARQRRIDLSTQREELERERASVHELQREIEAALAEWRRRADVHDDGAFLQAAEAAQRAHELEREIARLQRALAEARGATPVGAFDTALQAAERNVVEASLREVQATLDELEGQYRAANQAVGAAVAELGHLDGSAAAAELMLGIESERAQLRSQVAEYAVLTLARALLERQVQRYQERHQPQLLADVASLFAELTLGRYQRVYQRLDERGTFVAVRADGVEVLPEAMSTGTREQLYLAIRLAYVRQYCAAAEPLPVVLDDVLVNFDAARARATLKVLVELGQRTQVLFFTCHTHLRELARELEPTLAPLELAVAN
jgi:uncharacterized protein YhaN